MKNTLLKLALALTLALCTITLSAAPALAHGGHGTTTDKERGGDQDGDQDGDGDDAEREGFSLRVAFLTGGAEVNSAGLAGQGDPDGSGFARVRLSPERGRACINARVRQLDPLVLTHIHNAAAGKNGPVVIDFTALIVGEQIRGCVDADPALLNAILANPASYYVNTHSTTFRAGALRGQLEPPGSLRLRFAVEMSGAAEVGVGGDPDGRATARVLLDAIDLQVCINAKARKVAPLILAHIHRAPAGANGPVVIDFAALIDGVRVDGCVPVEPNLLQALRAAPASYYVNVHTGEFPAGALRGQLQ